MVSHYMHVGSNSAWFVTYTPVIHAVKLSNPLFSLKTEITNQYNALVPYKHLINLANDIKLKLSIYASPNILLVKKSALVLQS